MKPIYKESFYHLFSVQLYNDRIEIYFCPIKYEIPIQDIISVEMVNKIPWYIGWGLRLNLFSRRLYFLIHHNKSVKIKKKTGFWKEIIISPKNFEKFFSALEKVKTEKT